MELKITSLPDQTHAYNNTFLHNKDDFKDDIVFLKYKSFIYKSKSHRDLIKGSIGVNGIIRLKLSLVVGDKLKVELYNISKNILREVKFKLNFQKKKSTSIIIHEDIISEKIKQVLTENYFCDGQFLLLDYDGEPIILEATCKEGFINNDTIIKVFSEELNLRLMSSKVLKRELFQENFNFETIGIGGLNKELLNIFRRALSSRAVNPTLIEKIGIKHVKGVLLYGPPGTGKTLIARNIGNLLTQNPPKIINGPEILNKFVGQSEENVREIFKEAIDEYKNLKEKSSLHVIIFDEIDAICRKRGGGSQAGVTDSIVNQLLSMIDGVNALNNIFIIAMTNRKDLIDTALLRPGRIEIHIEITLPDRVGRKQILSIHTQKMKNNSMMSNNIDFDFLADITQNFSGAELEALVKNASSFAFHEMLALNQNEESLIITMNHFIKAKQELIPSFGHSEISRSS